MEREEALKEIDKALQEMIAVVGGLRAVAATLRSGDYDAWELAELVDLLAEVLERGEDALDPVCISAAASDWPRGRSEFMVCADRDTGPSGPI